MQLRLVVEAEDFNEALTFYRDALGLTEQAAFQGDNDARVVILDAGRATLELCNTAQKEMIDLVEVGHPASPKIRVAFEVADTAGNDHGSGRGGGNTDCRPCRDSMAVAQLQARRTGGAADHPVRRTRVEERMTDRYFFEWQREGKTITRSRFAFSRCGR